MVTTYGSFPGVRVEVAGGGITAVNIGDEEKLVLFGAASYDADGNVDGEATAGEPEQINARREADRKFGEGSDLALAMREALANGANINYLYGVATPSTDVVDEGIDNTAGATGTLSNYPVHEGTDIDLGGAAYEYRYDGAPETPTADDTVFINPLSGEYAVTSGSVTNVPATISYTYLDWNGAFGASPVENIVNENETGIYAALSDSDQVSVWLDQEVASLRQNYQLVNAISPAEPNATAEGVARYDTANYGAANQSVDADHYFKFAPSRLENQFRTITGGVAGVFAGNPISDPIYNDAVSGYASLEQEFTRTDEQNMRAEGIIPVREAGSIRIKDNQSTSTETDWDRDFWRRRIADRVILISKNIGESIIGRINDKDTRQSAERLISREMRELVGDRLLRPNSEDETNWYVDVYEDSGNANEVNIDIGFTPYGIVKRVDETITINT